jgi:hypothetical protein
MVEYVSFNLPPSVSSDSISVANPSVIQSGED